MTGDKSNVKEEGSKIFGFLKPRPGHGTRLSSAYEWARAKAEADIPRSQDRHLWRVHDDLYDFATFIHPGAIEFSFPIIVQQ